MNDNTVRHKILGILTKNAVSNDVARLKGGQTNVIGVSFDVLSKEIQCSDETIRTATSLLFTNAEVGLYDMAFKGLYITENGLSAFSTKKYLKLQNKNIREVIKDYIQITIPVLSMLIALIAVSNNQTDQLKDDIQQVKLELSNIKTIWHIHQVNAGTDSLSYESNFKHH